MYEVSCVGGNKVDAAAAIKQNHLPQRPHVSVRNQMMRFLRRSKSMVRQPTNVANKTERLSQNNYHHHSQHRHNAGEPRKVQVARNGMVVAIVDGLPFVVGAKNKKVISLIGFAEFVNQDVITACLFL